MDSVSADEVQASGGRYAMKLGVTFSDSDDPEYNHVVMFGFEPTLAVDSQNPRLDLNYIIHKKYWEELDVEPAKFTEDDGSELIHAHGYFDSPYDPSLVPNSVRGKFTELFGEELADGTFTNPPEKAETVAVPDIPGSHTVGVFDLTIQLDGTYTEELSEDDPRVGDGHYKSEMKDENGDVVHESYRMSHDVSWWFTPTGDGLEIKECFHKTWGERMKRDFEENYPGVTVVESYRDGEETPGMDSVPGAILADLASWFGEELVQASLSSRSLPEYVYECFECDEVSKVTPRDHCPSCGNTSLCRFESVEQYKEAIESRDELDEEVLEWLASADVSVEKESF